MKTIEMIAAENEELKRQNAKLIAACERMYTCIESLKRLLGEYDVESTRSPVAGLPQPVPQTQSDAGDTPRTDARLSIPIGDQHGSSINNYGSKRSPYYHGGDGFLRF